MILTDKTIKTYGENLISPFDGDRVESICYDLTIDKFCLHPDKYATEFLLKPNESVFIMSKEIVTLPNNLSAEVILRNGRIRQGLTLDAPIYHPGHKTPIYFRVTNVSNAEIELNSGNEIASIMFMQLDSDAEKPYSGAFQEEFNFNGMGLYTDIFSSQMKKIEKKEEDLHSMEHRLYANVLSIMAVFVAVFTIINVNAGMICDILKLKTLLVMNLSIIGSVGFLIILIDYFFNGNKTKSRKLPLAMVAVCFVAAVVLMCLQ